MTTDALDNTDTLEILAGLRQRSFGKLRRAQLEGWRADSRAAFKREIEAIDRAVSIVAGVAGTEGRISLSLSVDEAHELLRLLDPDDDGELAEDLLDRVAKRITKKLPREEMAA